jgi:hypothetical protein
MKLTQIKDILVQVFATIATMIPVAEYLFDGDKRGAEKRAYVIDEASKLLATHVHAFFGSALGKQVVGAVVDALVTLLNKAGNL